MSNRVLVGMSGGVDSSVAAYLLKERGYDVIGVTMQMLKDNPLGTDDAKHVADQLGIPFYTLNFWDEFEENVIQDFIQEYQAGRTPNPCIVCNRHVKWEALLKRGKELGADYIATGHYSRIVKLENGRYAIRRANSTAKDQTYALYRLTQEQLSHTIMPVGEYEKDEIRNIAVSIGMQIADKPDSQEICFIPDNDYSGYIKRRTGITPMPGNFVDEKGNVLGQHKGILHYTIGQRKGLNIAMGHPVFVKEIRVSSNEVVLGDSNCVFKRHLTAKGIHYMGAGSFEVGERMVAKIRYSHAGEWCTVLECKNDTISLEFDQPVRAITPGQAVVFYKEDYVLGGATIIR